jgi:hypothetical protein
MRTILICGMLSALVSGCYNPDLGDKPFLCAQTGKQCPDDYNCNAEGLCIETVAEPDLGVVVDQSLTDGAFLPSKEGPIFLDGALVLPSDDCEDKSTEPNNSSDTAFRLLNTGSLPGWDICYPGDVDHYSLSLNSGSSIAVKVTFKHDDGDLELALLDPDGNVVRESRSDDDNEEIKLSPLTKTGTYIFAVFGFGKATNKYDLKVTTN